MEEQADRKDEEEMSEFKIKLNDFAQDLVNQLKSVVPVRTGRLRNGIGYRIEEKGGDYYIYIVAEDYFKYLKERTKPQRLPTPKEMSMASPPLPKSDRLGIVRMNDLSPRAKGLMNKIDVDSAVSKIDFTEFEDELRKVIFYDFIP